MENFENILIITEKSLSNIRGIFDKEDIATKLKELEETSQKDFWKDKSLVKQLNKKFLSKFSTPNKSIKDINNLKDLYILHLKKKTKKLYKIVSKKRNKS